VSAAKFGGTLPLTPIFQGETGKTVANQCGAGFPACCWQAELRRAGFQTCGPWPFHPAFNPNSEVGNEIEKTRREPSAVGRVTPCAPRLQRAGAVFPRRRLPDPLRLKTPPGAAG